MRDLKMAPPEGLASGGVEAKRPVSGVKGRLMLPLAKRAEATCRRFRHRAAFVSATGSVPCISMPCAFAGGGACGCSRR